MSTIRGSLLRPGTLAVLLLLLSWATACGSPGPGEAAVPSDGGAIAALEPLPLAAG